MAYDGRSGRQRIWSSSTHFAFGTLLHSTEDFGRTWTNPESAPVKFPEATGQSLKQGLSAEFMPDKYPEFGQCVHKVARNPSRPERLFLQNHGGLFRSDNAGDSWTEIVNGPV